MVFESSKYVVSREPREVELQVGSEVLKLKVRDIPWSRRRQLISLSSRWDGEGNAHFDVDGYTRECLKYIIVEAPWGATTDAFLSQVNEELGGALDTLVPKAFSKGASAISSVEEVKKES